MMPTRTGTASPMAEKWYEPTPWTLAGIDGYIEVPERSQVEGVLEFTPEIQRDVAFLLDTTCSMSATANAMAEEFSAIVQDITALFPTCRPASPPTTTMMVPLAARALGPTFILRQQVTDNRDAVQTAMAAVDIHLGTTPGVHQGGHLPGHHR